MVTIVMVTIVIVLFRTLIAMLTLMSKFSNPKGLYRHDDLKQLYMRVSSGIHVLLIIFIGVCVYNYIHWLFTINDIHWLYACSYLQTGILIFKDLH